MTDYEDPRRISYRKKYSLQTGEDSKYKYLAPFKAEEWQKRVFYDTSPVLLCTGSAGGGKSRVALEKVHWYCLAYPGTTCLLLRKTREDAESSVVINMWAEVMARDPRVTKMDSKHRFEYANGSMIIWAGMKGERERKAIRSIGQRGGLGLVLMEEGVEFEEEDFDELRARMRDPEVPFTQIIVCTNPDAPLHWINVRLIKGGEASVHYSSVHDNPHATGRYKNELKRMKGTEGARLRDGLWVEGANLVIDTWLDDYENEERQGSGNVTLDAEYIPGAGDIVWWVDDGYAGEIIKNTNVFTPKSNPRVFLLAQLRSDGTINVFYEHYKVKMLHGEHIEKVKEISRLMGLPAPAYIVFDKSSPVLGRQLRKAGLKTVMTPKPQIDESVKNLQNYVGEDENKYRRFRVHPRCRMLRLELGSYSNDSKGNIIDVHSHGPDSCRYGVWYYEHGPQTDADVFGSDLVDMEEIERRIDEVMAQYDEIEVSYDY